MLGSMAVPFESEAAGDDDTGEDKQCADGCLQRKILGEEDKAEDGTPDRLHREDKGSVFR